MSRALFLLGGALAVTLVLAPTFATAGDEPKAEKITLKDGKARIESALKDSDPMDKVRKHPCKHYTVEMKSGQAFQIDMMSKDIDSYLRLEDAGGKELARDD